VNGNPPNGTDPGFLKLPHRTTKPRDAGGVTHVLDKGLTLATLSSLLHLAGPYIDFVKLGWGTSYVSGDVREKVAACTAHDVHVSPGGTLFEIAAMQNKVAELARWAAGLGMDTIEISEGAVGLSPDLKRHMIRDLSRDFRVVSEVGSKDPLAPVVPADWATRMEEDLEAGATYVIAEGRESGTVGLYTGDGAVREPLVEAVVGRIPPNRVIFEAPTKAQQAWFVKNVGTEVNLGNVPPEEVLGVETLRRGLRADTVWLSVRSWTPSLVAQAMFERSG
jgi:phosphosulfolactate synthase